MTATQGAAGIRATVKAEVRSSFALNLVSASGVRGSTIRATVERSGRTITMSRRSCSGCKLAATITTAEGIRSLTVPVVGGSSTPPPIVPRTVSRADGLKWAPPALNSPTRIAVSTARPTLKLDDTKDYIVDMPPTAVTASGGVQILGGRNVVLIGGHISIPWQGETPAANSRRGLYLKNQTGTVHVEGLLIDGEDLGEGINLDQRRRNTVQLQNIRVIGIHARDEVRFSDAHPDIVQSWGGPAVLRIDRLTGTTDYQGLFLQPGQYDRSAMTQLAELRRINISSFRKGAYLLWQAQPFPMQLSDVWVRSAPERSASATMWPSTTTWQGASLGLPPTGDFVPAGSAGPAYASPGYSG